MTTARQAARRMTAQRIGGTTDPIGERGSRPEVVEWVIDPVPTRRRSAVGHDGTRTPRPPRRPTLAIAAVVVAAVIAAVTLATGGASSNGPSTFASTDLTTIGRPPLAAGWQRVSSLGVEADAPASWPINAWNGCGDPAPPPAQVIRARGFRTMCGLAYGSPGVTSTLDIRHEGEDTTNEMAPATPIASTSRVEATRGGLPVTISTYDRPRGRTETVITFRGQDVEVAVASSDPALVQRIAASVWPVAVDSVGCPTDLPSEPSWDRPRSGPAVDIGRPTSITVCSYPDERDGHQVLGASAVFTGAAAEKAAATINTARAGPVADTPTTCTTNAFQARLLLYVREPDGSTVEVRVKFEGCTDRRVATPTGVSQATRAQATALMAPLHTGYGTGGDLPER